MEVPTILFLLETETAIARDELHFDRNESWAKF